MVKKIGNILLCIPLLLGVMSWCAEPVSVHLGIIDEAGNATNKTGPTIPVILEIVVKNSTVAADNIAIDGLENFTKEQLGTTQQMNSINGVTTRKTIYRFALRTDRVGNFVVGPARVTLDGTVYNSEKVQLAVAQGYAPQNQKVELELILGQQAAYVGQKVPFTIRFYANKQYELLGMEPLQLEKFKVGSFQGPVEAARDRHGRSERYLEWQTYITPQEPGEFFIPALKAYYKEHHRNGLYGNFLADILDPGRGKSYVYSHAVPLHVQPLPHHDGPVHAIGEFTTFHASVSQHEAKEGEGIVFTLTLEGQGNLEDILHPHVVVPEGLAYYDSQSTISDNKKIFEYIIQGKQAGTWQLPEQQFTFFDLRTKKYRTLKTQPLSLVIKAGDNVATRDTAPQQETREMCNALEAGGDMLLPLNEHYTGDPLCEHGLPYVFLVLGFLAPLVAVIIFFSVYSVRLYRARDTDYSRKKRAYAHAKKQIKRAAKAHDVSRLYDIFVTFVAMRYNLEPASVSADVIKQKFVRFSQATVVGWDAFFAKITEQAYGRTLLTSEEKEELLKNAHMWLGLFEKSE